MELQCYKYKFCLRLTICIFVLHLAQILAFLQISELLQITYDSQDTFYWFSFVCTTTFFSTFMELQRSKSKIGLKIDDFVFLLHFAQNWPFCKFQSFYYMSIFCKVDFWYCFVCTTTFQVHLWIYSVPNGRSVSKLQILYF